MQISWTEKVALPGVQGASWDLCREYEGWYEFLGKRAGRVKGNNPQAKEKCEEFMQKYEEMKRESEAIIKKENRYLNFL